MKKKNNIKLDDQINLFPLFIIIWDGKIKILLITIILFFVGFGYNSQTSKNYLNSLLIKKNYSNQESEIENIKNLIKLKSSFLNLSQSTYSYQSNQLVQTDDLYIFKFVNELKDYEEFIFSLNNSKKIQEEILTLKIEDQQVQLFNYLKLLEIDEIKKEDNFVINFIWHDPDEAKKILNGTLDLTSKNLKKKIDQELTEFLEFEKKFQLNSDRVRLNYLEEQSSIAKELNIVNNQIDSVNLTQSSLSLNINTADIAYYLRGYKAIDKEIELINNRKYVNLEFAEQELNNFLNKEVEFVDYNINLMTSELINNDKKILIISIVLGLIFGVFYVLLSFAFQLKKAS